MRWFDTGQTLVKTLKRKAQPLMIDPQLVQYGRVQVADGHRILNNVLAEVVGLAVRHPALNAATGQPG